MEKVEVAETTQSNKRIAKNTLFMYFRMLITMAVGLYASRVILQVLGASDYGLNNVVAGFVALFTFVNNTLTTGTQRFLSYSIGKGDSLGVRKVFATALSLHLLFGIIFIILLESVGVWFLLNKLNIPEGRENAAFWVFQFSILSTVAQIVQVPYNSVLVARERFNIYAYMSIYDAVMKLIIVYLIQVFDFDKLIFYSALFSGVSLSSTFIYNYYCRRNFNECNTSIRGNFDKVMFKEIGTFSGWNTMGCLAVVASNQGVNVLINLFLGTIINAARGISLQVTHLIGQLVNNFLVAVNPQIVKLYAERKYDEMFILAKNASKYGCTLILLVGIPLILEMNYVLTLWLGDFPDHTIYFSIIAILQAIITSVSKPLVTILHATGRMKLPNIFDGSILLLILPVSYLLLNFNVDIDVVIAITLLPWLGELVICLVLVKKMVGLNTLLYLPHVIFKLIFVSSIVFVFGYLVKCLMEESFLRVFCVSLTCLITLLLSVYYILVDKETRKQVIPFIKNHTLKRR